MLLTERPNGVRPLRAFFSSTLSQDSRFTADFTTANHPGATGEMIQDTQMVGANTIQMDWIQMGPWTSSDEKGFGVAPLFVESALS